MPTMHRVTVIGALVSLALTSGALAGDGEIWSFDLSTTGQDVFYQTPTAVDPDAPQYDASFQIDSVILDVIWSSIPISDVDVTDQIPPEHLMGTASAMGPAPISVYSDSVIFPEPPAEPVGIAAEIDVLLDADGFGQLSVTNVTLGTVEIDTGVLGLQMVQITSVRVVGSVTVTAVTPSNPADLTGDGSVNVFDLLELLGQWGACADPEDCPADLTGDDQVNVFDLLDLLGAWG